MMKKTVMLSALALLISGPVMAKTLGADKC